MRIPVVMPKAGYSMETGLIVAWLRKLGDRVRRGESIAEIETDKSVMEMDAPADGTLIEIVQEVGMVVPVGDVMAYLESDG